MATNRYLTIAEQKLIRFLRKGFSNRVIAEKMGVSQNTVKYHLKNIYIKLNVKSRLEAICKYNNHKP